MLLPPVPVKIMKINTRHISSQSNMALRDLYNIRYMHCYCGYPSLSSCYCGFFSGACPAGSAACLLKGDNAVSLGQATQELGRDTDGHLVLTYMTETEHEKGDTGAIPAGCTRPYQTKIMFACPQRLSGQVDSAKY